jgi:hypothetical protein
MKLAEALILRADLRKRTEELRERLRRNARIHEGDQPVEQPEALMSELDRIAEELELLSRRVNWTNANLMFDPDHRLSDAIAMRDTLDLRIRTLRSVIDEVSQRERWLTRMAATLDPANLQKQLDDLSRKRRQLDTRLQAISWQEDLLEPNY